MKPTWKGIAVVSHHPTVNCRCLICGKEFLYLRDGYFNMRLVTCPTCKQRVWVPRCPNGCPSFKEKEK